MTLEELELDSVESLAAVKLSRILLYKLFIEDEDVIIKIPATDLMRLSISGLFILQDDNFLHIRYDIFAYITGGIRSWGKLRTC